VRTSSARGSVTAELVLTLPAITLVLALAIGALSAQIQAFQLVGSASMIAKAIARGESSNVVNDLLSQAGQEVRFELSEIDNSVCVKLSLGVKLPGFKFEIIDLSETQCARSQGR